MNSNLFAAKFYQMDPTTDDLIPLRELQDGMVVLIESSVHREDPSAISFDPAHTTKLLRNNRWCEVSKLELMHTGVELQARFIGIYADGTKMSRYYGGQAAFYVKKDSLPKVDVVEHPEADNAEGESDLAEYAEGYSAMAGYAAADAQASLDVVHGESGEASITEEETTEADFDGNPETDEDDSEYGPLVRAMLLEKRTVTEVTETYGPPSPFRPFRGVRRSRY